MIIVEKKRKRRVDFETKEQVKEKAYELWQLAVDKKWGVWCEVSPFFGKKQRRTARHHFFPKGKYHHLKYDVDNGVPLTYYYHIHRHHGESDPIIHIFIRKNRGEEWYQSLEKRALNKPKGSYKTKAWYEEQVRKLKEFLYE